MTSFVIFCPLCSHYRENDCCDAFPEGIPKKVLEGEQKHEEPIRGDNGITFDMEMD